MKHNGSKSQFRSELLLPAAPGEDAPWTFVVLPREVSAELARRGRVTVDVAMNGYGFRATLEPDGQLSHWLRIEEALVKSAGVSIGDRVAFEIAQLEEEPDPEVPSDLSEALAAAPEALAVWEDTTPMARLDWIHWVTSAKQAKTRVKRISDACSMLASGKRRVCCFDPSGFYSKALNAPKVAD